MLKQATIFDSSVLKYGMAIRLTGFDEDGSDVSGNSLIKEVHPDHLVVTHASGNSMQIWIRELDLFTEEKGITIHILK